jgi:hypothetical protein
VQLNTDVNRVIELNSCSLKAIRLDRLLSCDIRRFVTRLLPSSRRFLERSEAKPGNAKHFLGVGKCAEEFEASRSGRCVAPECAGLLVS